MALAQGDTCQALHHYGELVSKALMGRGSAEHWAYAEYGWLLFQVGGKLAGWLCAHMLPCWQLTALLLGVRVQCVCEARACNPALITV